ncbi:MAG TPA: chloride channel protein [Candidatus Limnocylindrales bacterium]|nr:chloride channel protein [Candidatus Limnocylindrales bacterium]
MAKLQQREDQVFLVLALVIGALTGLTVVAFILLTEREGLRLYPAGGAPWRRVLFPVAGSLGIGYLLFRYFPNARGSGVPQTKAALFAREGRITLRTVLGKFFCTSATLASGIPLGREGPSVQVGAGIASVLGRRLGLRPEKVKALLPVGAAAAIAAAFNTPLAAVLFSLEEIMGDLHAPVLGSVVLASATSWLVLRLLLGNNPLFKVPQYQLIGPLKQQVEEWQAMQLSTASAKLLIYQAFIEDELGFPKHLARRTFSPCMRSSRREPCGASRMLSPVLSRSWIPFHSTRQRPSWRAFCNRSALHSAQRKDRRTVLE